MTEFLKATAEKTFKRETAWFLMAYLIALVIAGFFVEPPMRDFILEVLKIKFMPSMLYVGAAFGMEWARKQTEYGGQPQHEYGLD